MSDKKPTYQELLSKIEQLQSENKHLRLRPAIHSNDARLLDFMKIKSQLANAMLETTDIKQAIRISIQYLSKIENIHGLGFFKYHIDNQYIEILQDYNLPKRFINQFDKKLNQELISGLFPNNNKFYSTFDNNNNSDFQRNFKAYESVLILPIIKNEKCKYSLLLISRKKFKNSRLFKIVYENIQAQLRSSYSRILTKENASTKSQLHEIENLEIDNNYENINKELLKQLKIYREQNLKYTEELDLYKSIIQQQKDIIIRINREGQILYNNPAFEQIEILNEGDDSQLINYFGEGDFPGLDQILHDFEEGIQQVNCEIQLMVEYPRWFNFFFSPIKNRRDLIVEIQIVARNIDKIIRLEQKLELQKEMLVNMLNKSDYLGLAIDQDGYIKMVTDNLKEKTGLNDQQFLHHSLLELLNIREQKEVEKFLKAKNPTASLKTHISFKLPHMNHQYFNLEINPLNCISVKSQYFIGNLYPDK